MSSLQDYSFFHVMINPISSRGNGTCFEDIFCKSIYITACPGKQMASSVHQDIFNIPKFLYLLKIEMWSSNHSYLTFKVPGSIIQQIG